MLAPDRVQVRFFRSTSSPEGFQISNTIVLRHPSGEACVMFSSSMDTKLQKWIKWLDIIKIEISEILIGRNIFWQLLESVESDSVKRGKIIYGHYLCSSFTSHVMMAIRRQIKDNKQSISLVRLLNELIENPEIISSDYFKSLWKDSTSKHKADTYFHDYSLGVYNHISREVVKADLEHLLKHTNKIEALSDQRLAHRDKKLFQSVPSITELEACIETFKIIFCKYYYLFHAEHVDLLPDFHNPDLKQIFYDKSLLDKLT